MRCVCQYYQVYCMVRAVYGVSKQANSTRVKRRRKRMSRRCSISCMLSTNQRWNSTLLLPAPKETNRSQTKVRSTKKQRCENRPKINDALSLVTEELKLSIVLRNSALFILSCAVVERDTTFTVQLRPWFLIHGSVRILIWTDSDTIPKQQTCKRLEGPQFLNWCC